MKPFLLVFILSLGHAFAEKPPKNPIPDKSSEIRTQPGSYCSLVRQGDDFYIFSEQAERGKVNAASKICPGINVYKASGKDLTRSNFLKTVAPNDLINDIFTSAGKLDPDRLLTRLGAQYSDKDQKFYAIAYVSSGYPPVDGLVVPALFESATANVKGDWIYKGKIKPDGKPITGWGSGGNLILNENPGPAVNHESPLQNKFVHYQDSGPSLFLIYSNDGSEWFYHKDAQGNPANLRPPEFHADAAWIFPSAIRTKNDGLFMFVTIGWPPQGHRLLHSDDGIAWKVVGNGSLETNVGGLPQSKNVSLGYDDIRDTIYLLITRTGSDHFKNIVDVKPKDLLASPASAR